jgi:serine O-acetyltransferase
MSKSSLSAYRAVADLVGLLREDLERQFALSGNPEKKVGFFQFISRSPHPRFFPLILCRLSRLMFILGIPLLPSIFSYLNLVLFGLQITPRCDIGGGLFLPHPSGIVVGAWRIGRDVTLFQQVTLGATAIDMDFTPDLLPEVCSNVTIGAGAKVLGGICLGEGVTVGANAVVLTSARPYSTIVGVPAREVITRVSQESSK